MNEATPDQDRLLDEAIDLIIRHQNDPDNPVALEMIRAWRARSPDNEEAWQRVSKIHGASGLILSERRKIERREGLGLTRRNFMVGGLATLGFGAATYSFGPSLLLRTRADYMTAKGEIRRIDLPDGSGATLGPESAIALNFGAEARTVDLLAGMSFFEVASDASRPFSVLSDSMRATALGTAFDVSEDAGVFSVGVDHGLVDVRAAAGAPESIASLTARQWMTIDPVSGDIDRGQREAGQIASWRDKLLIAERETVSALAARIGRWLPGRIIIADRLVGRQRVSGVFDLNDPLRALQAVVHPAGARVRQVTPYVTVVSSI
ncbi:iron dicitrate transport regulator FecR [Rhizobium sp. Root708]|uniref:FecR family protein n=1 Tax=Rhizobium sp. Root708 TaxID=1736592 RepID=UPI0007010EE6|nr:FecR domain-containing protein [Rhizobium sp. Root708]KRB62038.1 iron dicitrate transport regulator FecR [Rhizobium sp. Root708]